MDSSTMSLLGLCFCLRIAVDRSSFLELLKEGRNQLDFNQEENRRHTLHVLLCSPGGRKLKRNEN